MSKETFLKEILGDSGHEALCNTVQNSKDLDNLIFTRSLLSWINVISRYGHNGTVPGNVNSFQLNKTEQGLSGFVEIEDSILSFNNKSDVHVAAILAVSLGADKPINAPSTNSIVKLGKSIDCMVKYEFAAKHLQKNVPKYHAPEKHGPPAEPVEAIKPEQPVSVQPAIPNALKKKQKEKPKKSFIFKLKKHDLAAHCNTCAKAMFDETSFLGCLCYDNEGVSLLKNKNEVAIKFHPSTDSDFILALMENIKNG